MANLTQDMLEREAVANRSKHWVRLVTACNSKCLFCLDSDTPRNVYLEEEAVKKEILRGRTEFDAWKIILSGGEAALHPKYIEFIKYAKEVGYGRIQTVTNGWRYADQEFFEACMEAGLQELTFSLHGHNQELHERMTAHPGSFERIVKGIIRAKRHPSRPIVSVDVCINKQNVGYLDKIVELSIGLGVTEFDLLHVIPQAAAFDNREELFYDPLDHLEMLHKVFRLNRHPRFVIWTNRFPVEFLEGMEDLIQDPHKMLDEVNGRRFQVRRYLDEGKPLDCRQQERCQHCFIESFCTTMDRSIARQNDEAWDVWWPEDPGKAIPALPFGCRWLGAHVVDSSAVSHLPDSIPWYLRMETALRPEGLPDGTVLELGEPDFLETCLLNGLPAGLELVILLNRRTAPWLLTHREELLKDLSRIRLHQPSHEQMKTAAEEDVRDPASFFAELNMPIRCSGLPACLAPGVQLVEPLHVLEESRFEKGRYDVRALAKYHVHHGYRSKSLRCRDCVVKDRCDGAHINLLRDQGLALLQPLTESDWAREAKEQLMHLWPEPQKRLKNGRMFEPVAPSLHGHPQPSRATEDPLAVIARKVAARRAARRAEIRARIAQSRES